MTGIGVQIRRLRRERNLTQAELADQVGIAQRNISRYESGHAKPRKSTVAKLAQALEVGVDELLGIKSGEDGQREAADPELARLVREISKLPDEDREALKRVIDLVLKQHRVQKALAV